MKINQFHHSNSQMHIVDIDEESEYAEETRNKQILMEKGTQDLVQQSSDRQLQVN